MRRRRPNNGTWLPTSTTDLGDGYNGSNVETQGLYGSLGVLGEGAVSTYLLPLTADTPIEGDAFAINNSLADIVGSEYFLKRIVGKFYCAYTEAAEGGFDFCKVALGFMVCRADSALPDIPIGAPSATFWSNADPTAQAAFNSYSPLAAETVREPWIWRRSWVLASSSASLPRSTANFGSVLDGGHIDAKTKRRVVNDERLFMALSVCRWPYTNAGLGDAGSIDFDIDLRLFASLRKARNRGVF